MTPLSTIVSLFGDMIPEAEAAEVTGEVGLAAHIAGPPWDWSFEPAAQALAVSGALPKGFGGDRIRWKRNGIPYETGPGTSDWVRLEEAGWLPEAAIAAAVVERRAAAECREGVAVRYTGRDTRKLCLRAEMYGFVA